MQGPIINSAESASQVSETGVARIVNSGITSSGVTASGVVSEYTPREVAYVIKDPHFDEFVVYASANAWWMDRTKVEKLIDAFKQGHMVGTAKFYAGVSKRQYQYFNDVHPEFCSVIDEIRGHPVFIKAMNSVIGGLDGDPRLSMSLLRARHPDFKRPKKGDEEEVDPSKQVIQQTVQVAVSQNVDTTRIAALIEAAADTLVAAKRGGESVGA